MLTDAMIEMIKNAIEIVSTMVGWGTVTIVIENGRVAYVRREVSIKVNAEAGGG